MKLYIVPKIEKPFIEDDLKGKYKKGDVGIYDKHVLIAKKQMAIMEVETPFGKTYADPKKVFKNNRYIYRYYKQTKPMKLFILTPEYNNKGKFEPKEIPTFNKEGASKLVSAWKEVLKKNHLTL